jgi:lipopolysaccharide transport system ATP-binding protein
LIRRFLRAQTAEQENIRSLMPETLISVNALGKKYLIDHRSERPQYKSLRDAIADGSRAALTRFLPNGKKTPRHTVEDFWALRDVSFDVKQGEVLGIIGRNGAGKSTLLKVLSRITDPTEGEVRIRGRVASLLEVGTGFHPELTGRENIYLNGSILGMSKAEIKRKFDEIVAFAEVEKFLDTPVKRFSSGMYVRLAFAVAAHLEPEILIVDEVLAVGDTQFQEKCLGKMRDISSGDGRTVLFVSHNLATVKSLCSSAVLLKNGRVVYRGSTSDAIQEYISTSIQHSGHWIRNGAGGKDIRFESVSLTDLQGIIKSDFDFSEPVCIDLRATILKDLKNAEFAIRVINQEGNTIFTTGNSDHARSYLPLTAGPTRYIITIPQEFLNPGRYLLKIAAVVPKICLHDLIDDELSFVVHETGSLNEVLHDDRVGLVHAQVRWELQ